MLDSESNVCRFLRRYAQLLVADIPDERMAEQPLAGMNHPAWILGHLALTPEAAAAPLGGEKTLPAEWAALFGPGSKPTAVRAAYPSKEELLRAVEQAFECVFQRAATATPEQWARPTSNPRMKDTLPTVKDVVAFLITGHLGVHLGQLSSWRRSTGLPPLF